MPVTIEDLSSVKKILHIEVPAEEATRELEKAYTQLKKTAKIKGFRPGKTPRTVLERLYKKDVQADVMSRLIQDSFIKAIKETDLKVVGSPHIDPPQLKENNPVCVISLPFSDQLSAQGDDLLFLECAAPVCPRTKTLYLGRVAFRGPGRRQGQG